MTGHQGIGAPKAASSNIACCRGNLVVAPFAHRVRRQRGDHKVAPTFS